MRNKMHARPLLAIWLILVSILVAGCDSLASRDKVRADLIRLCDSFTVPPSFKKTGTQEVIKPTLGSFTNLYETEVMCAAAREPFYVELLTKGWEPTRPGSSYLYKDNYVVSASCESGYAAAGGQTVSVICSWDADGTFKDILK